MSLYTEEKVNTYSADYQYQPSVSPLAGGGYVVVWTSRGQDGSNDGIYAQRYDASGIPVGPEFRVNSSTSGYQLEGQVTGLSDGGFVVPVDGPERPRRQQLRHLHAALLGAGRSRSAASSA
ncbi:hypothetical protein MASR2M50_10460 [Thauera sp.]